MKIYLYVKTHNITGLKYFGKTSKSNPISYKGSGVYWLKHLKKHGYDVSTQIIGCYDDINVAQQDAISFSKKNNIVKSPNWANLREENALDGAPIGHIGHKFTENQLKNLSNISKNRWNNLEYKNKLSQTHKDRWTNELKQKQSMRLKIIFWTEERKQEHSQKMQGHPGSKKLKGIPKASQHNKKVSEALTGRKLSVEHKQKLSVAKPRITRICDRKEMSINHYTRWLKSSIIV